MAAAAIYMASQASEFKKSQKGEMRVSVWLGHGGVAGMWLRRGVWLGLRVWLAAASDITPRQPYCWLAKMGVAIM